MTRTHEVFGRFEHSARMYRAWALDDTLLYVGSTRQAVADRMRQHMTAGEPWVPMMARITTEEFCDIGPAERAEDHAIATEHPVFNRRGIARGRPGHAARLPFPPSAETMARDLLLRFLVERPPVRDPHDADTTSRAWCVGPGAFDHSTPPLILLRRSMLLDYVASQTSRDPRAIVDAASVTVRRVRDGKRTRWLAVNDEQFTTQQWATIPGVWLMEPPPFPEHPETLGRLDYDGEEI